MTTQPAIGQDINRKIYLGTGLIEKNRWLNCRDMTKSFPTILLSNWVERIRQDGFDGIELWQNHALMCTETEFVRLEQKTVPVAVFNSYVDFDQENDAWRTKAAEVICRLKAGGVKYNFGNNSSLRETYIRNLRKWVSFLPADIRILCECHGGSLTGDDSKIAREIFEELGEKKYQAMVHLNTPLDKLKEWFDSLGGRLTHTHVVLAQRSANSSVNKLDKLDKKGYTGIEQNIRFMLESGYRGSFTIEFTSDITFNPPDTADIDAVYHNAIDDLNFLRGILS